MAVATPRQDLANLLPEHIAFAGEARTDARSALVLCWPALPAAWSVLAQATASLNRIRSEATPFRDARPAVTSWMQAVAPQLSRPVIHDLIAGESTLASLVRRLPIRMAVAVAEHETLGHGMPEPLRCRELFAGCLAAYDAHLRDAQQPAARVVMIKGKEPPLEILYQASYQEVGARLATSGPMSAMELRFWTGTSPLPLELAELAATAVTRHLQDPDKPHPLVETIKVHAVPLSRLYEPSTGRKKRR